MTHPLITRKWSLVPVLTFALGLLVLLNACQLSPSPTANAQPTPGSTKSITPANPTPIPTTASLTEMPEPVFPSQPKPTQDTLPSAGVNSDKGAPQPVLTDAKAGQITTPEATPSTSAVPTTANPGGAQPAAPTTAPTCSDIAAFYGDVTIPDDTAFEQNVTFTKTWRFRNEGDCTWDSSYAIVFSGGEMLNTPLINPLPVRVAPGEIVNLSLEMRTPDRGGNFQSFWQFQNGQGARFGTGVSRHDPFWAQVVVYWYDEEKKDNPGAGQNGSAPAPGSAGTQPTPVSPGNPSTPGNPTPPANPTPAPDPNEGQASIPGAPASCKARTNVGFLQVLLRLINAEREDNGLAALAPSAPLYAAAATHSADMACNNFINHIGSDGSSWYNRIAAQGYTYSVALENIMVANPDFGGNAQYAFDWWMNSQVHRDNILNPNVSELGLGYVFSPDSEYGGYFTLVLAKP